MTPVGFTTLSDRGKLKLYETIASGRQATLRFRLFAPDIFATGYSINPTGAWCMLKFNNGRRFTAFCPGGESFSPLLRDALCDRAEDMALAEWAAWSRRQYGRAPVSAPNKSLRQYWRGRLLRLPASPVPTTVKVVRSFIIRRFGSRYYHYIFLAGVTDADNPLATTPARETASFGE